VFDDIPKFPYRMTIEYKDIGWDELCAQTIEQFGPPGARFTTSTTTRTMTFLFKSEQDFLFFKLKWSEYEF